MLCKAYQQEFTFVALESLMKRTPLTEATGSNLCSTLRKDFNA